MALDTALRENVLLKAASLLFAVFLWLYVRGEERPIQIFSLPLEMEGLPADLAIAGEAVDNVAVRVRAPETALRALTPSRFRARVNLSGAKAGEMTIPLGRENVRAPIGVNIIQVDPPSITLRLEQRGRRDVPVVARLEGKPAAGYETRGYTVVPDHVTVEGPESLLASVREATTEEIDLTGRSADLQRRVKVAPGQGGLRVAGDATVLLTVSIGEARETRTYPDVRLSPNLPAGATFKAEPDAATAVVVLEGTRKALERIQPGNVSALLDLEGMSPRAVPYDVRPRVVLTPPALAEGVTVRSVSPQTVSVRLSPGGRGK